MKYLPVRGWRSCFSPTMVIQRRDFFSCVELIANSVAQLPVVLGAECHQFVEMAGVFLAEVVEPFDRCFGKRLDVVGGVDDRVAGTIDSGSGGGGSHQLPMSIPRRSGLDLGIF